MIFIYGRHFYLFIKQEFEPLTVIAIIIHIGLIGKSKPKMFFNF